jgi:hypothetical protein
MKVSGIRGLPDVVIDNGAIDSMEVVSNAPENGLARYELKVTYRVPEPIDAEVIEDLHTSTPLRVYEAPLAGVEFVMPWLIM